MLSFHFVFHHQSSSPPHTASPASEMAAKRFLEDQDNISDKPEGKRVRRLPSFTVVIRKAVEADNIQKLIQNLCLALEPRLRTFMREEMEQTREEMEQMRDQMAQMRVLIEKFFREQWFSRLAHLLQRSPQMLIEEPKSPSALQLIFKEQPSDSIYTEKKIEGVDGFPLQILIKIATGARPTTALPSSIKLEIVVLNGDFPYDDSENWSSSEFNSYVVKERKGKKPLLTGTTDVKLKDGVAAIDELKFSDNSSWTRSGKFRIGVRVSSEHQQSLNIREAVSNPIKVKDRRGEVYRKHNRPSPNDDAWRPVNIGKNGGFHKKLGEMNINDVQDFLKLSVTDFAQLRNTLGMPDKIWEATINHAGTCPLGDKLYIHNNPPFYNALNHICDVQNSLVGGSLKTHQEFNMPMKNTVHETVLGAHNCSDGFEEFGNPSQELMPNNELVGAAEQCLVIRDEATVHETVLGAYNCSDGFEEFGIPAQVETHQNDLYFDVGLPQNNELWE